MGSNETITQFGKRIALFEGKNPKLIYLVVTVAVEWLCSSSRLLQNEIALHAETTISTLFWFCVLLQPRFKDLPALRQEALGTLGKAPNKIEKNVVDFG